YILFLQFTTVLSNPVSYSSATTIPKFSPFKSLITCLASVGEGLPLKFALGAAIGIPVYSKIFLATGCEGILTATLSISATVLDASTPSLSGSIKEIGPGQK